MDPRSNSKLVASVEGEASAPQAGPPRKRPNRGNPNWLPRQSLEQLLDAPCKIHSGVQPSSHTLRQCSFARRLSQGMTCRLLRMRRRPLVHRLPTTLRLRRRRLTTTVTTKTTTLIKTERSSSSPAKATTSTAYARGGAR